ncbi:MAG: DUF368 domain-containing protein [Planctomycetales bacterium]
MKRFIPTADLVQVARGLLMGSADIIPGVSGGTVALILGIYERLVTAISRIDASFVGHLGRREWREAARHADLRFLLALGGGIALGIIGLSTLMHYLLEHQRERTYAAFFGLILASSLLVARAVARWSAVEILLLIAGAFSAWYVVSLQAIQSPPAGNLYVFFCGVIGICAMILPGISGAFILLVLGKYEDITGLLRNALHGQITVEAVATIAVFCAGCAIGLLAFSRFLRWLLGRHEPQTMAALCGVMLGSLRKIWPFQRDADPTISEFQKKWFEPIWPERLDANVWIALAIAAAAFALVLALDRLAGRKAVGGRQ